MIQIFFDPRYLRYLRLKGAEYREPPRQPKRLPPLLRKEGSLFVVVMKPLKFKTLLIKPDPDSGWHFVHVKGKIGEKIYKECNPKQKLLVEN